MWREVTDWKIKGKNRVRSPGRTPKPYDVQSRAFLIGNALLLF